MNKFKLAIPLFMAVVLLAMQSCVKKEDVDFDKVAGTNWTPDFSIPLVHSKIGIDKITGLVDSNSYKVDSTGRVSLIYHGQIYSVNGYEFLPLVSQSDYQAITLSPSEISTLSSTNTVTTQRSKNYTFITNGEHIDSMVLSKGSLDVHISSYIRHSGTLTITLPTAKLNGVAFAKNVPFTYNGVAPMIVDASLDLSGYDIDFTTPGPYNVLPITYSVTFNNSGNLTTIADAFSVTSSFNNLAIKRVFGNFGVRSLSITEDSSHISLFNNIIGGTAFFEDPKITFLIDNSFGMTIDAHFNSLYAHTVLYGNPVVTGAPNPIPILTPTTVGTTAHNTYVMDKNNSNVVSIMQKSPLYIGYDVSGTTNMPFMTDNFLEDSSRLKIDVNVELPLVGYANGFVISDTTDFTLDEIKEIEEANFRLNITNGYPLDAHTQVYFLDSMNVKLDSLISPYEQVVVAGIVQNGKVTTPTLKTSDEKFNKERLNHIYSAKKVLTYAVLNSVGYQTLQTVKIYSDYILDVRIGVQAKLNFNNQ